MPARWRIVGWLLMTTTVALVSVGAAVRAALVNLVDNNADAEVVQEVDEFQAFASGGRDPETGQSFRSTERLLATYLAGQYPGDDEMIIGLTAQEPPTVFQLDRQGDIDDDAPYPELSQDTAALAVLTDPAQVSGVRQTPAGEMRWGRVDVVGAGPADPGGALIVAQFTRNRQERVDVVMRLIAGVALGGLVLTAGVAWLVAGRILAPVAAIRRVATGIGERDLTSRVPVVGRDDVAALAVTINEMLDRVQEAYRSQREFVDDAGHELRTPITVIRGHLELMSADAGERAATVHLVCDELDRMSRIVSDLMVLAKAERPDFVRPARVDVADLTLEIDAKMQALGKRRWLLTHVGEGSAELDAQRVTQAVLQLATNAVTHTSPGSEIRLRSAISDDRPRTVSFVISDTGPGVPAGDAQRIFERFAHGSTAAADGDRPGAGLGLAIVRAIAEGHGGNAWVVSNPGHGATFGIDLPAQGVGAGGSS